MHVMFIHPNFPAQFGHIANYLATTRQWTCTFITSIDTTHHKNLPFNHINYRIDPNAPQPKVFYNPNSLDGLMQHLAAIYRGMRQVGDRIKPDLVVGHMSYGTMLYLRNLYQCPFIGYFEMLPAAFWSDGLVLRKEFPPTENIRLFNATYHALTYLHMHNVDAMYCPTEYQRSTAPKEFQDRIRVIFDGINTEFFSPEPATRPTTFRGITIPEGTRVLTYCSRGLESARGFDIFMKVAKRICDQMDNVIILVAGQERTFYGHEQHHIEPKGISFKQWVLNQDDYDLSRIHLLGLIPLNDLRDMFRLSDLHIYLTAPYVLSWSMLQAMSTGCVVLGSDTAPVQEAITHEKNGMLLDFYDVDALTEKTLEVLREPEKFRHLGDAARETVLERYEQSKCITRLVELFEETAGSQPVQPQPSPLTTPIMNLPEPPSGV
ncbi:MAG: glycosyltransferase [Gemmataceae bacterium]